MFPQINKNKKKAKIGTQLMHKEVEDALKQLSVKVKKASKNIDSDLVSDFNKVCRLKEIPQFYSHYFLYFIQKSSQGPMKTKFSQEIQKIMMGKSYYNLIINLLKQRQQNIFQISNKLSIVQGFILMNAGKSVPLTIKAIINQMIKDCQTLSGLKVVEQRAIDQLASLVKQARDKLKELVQIFISWKFALHNLQGADAPSIKKMRIIFPYHGINCILHSLYDLQLIKTSFLSNQAKFLKVQFDPFLLSMQTLKKGNKLIQNNFVQFLSNLMTKSIYQPAHNAIMEEIPKDSQKIREQQLNNLQKKKAERQGKSMTKLNLSSSKMMSRSQSQDKKRTKIQKDGLNYLHSKIILQSNDQSNVKNRKSRINSMKSIINIDMIDKIYTKNKKSGKIKVDNSFLSKSRSKQKKQLEKNLQISQIIQKPQTALSNRKNRDKKGKKSSSRDKQIQNLYSLKKKGPRVSQSPQRSLEKSLAKSQNLQVMAQQNKKLERQISQHRKQKQKLMRIVKRAESRTTSENRFFQKKMEDYEKQVNLLKDKLKQRQEKVKQKITQKYGRQDNRKKQIQKIYKVNKESSNSPFFNLAQSQLTEKKQNNKHLQNTIKQLNKQKLKLQKLLQAESGKINKQKSLYEKKLQKYEDIIQKLKRDMQSNMTNMRKNNNASIQAQYSSLKNNNQAIKNIYTKQSNLNSELGVSQSRKSTSKFDFTGLIVEQVKRVKQSKASPLKMQGKNNFTLKKDELQPVTHQYKNPLIKSRDLQIIQNKKKNAIQIIYDVSRRKRSKIKHDIQKKSGEEIKFSRTNQFQNKMTRLEKEKQVLQKKLSITADNRSSVQVTLMKKLQLKQNQLEKYKNILEREQNKKYGLESKMRQVKKSLAYQYQNRLQRQRQRFFKQNQILSKKLQQEKLQKQQKQRFLSRQLIFLKEMQMKQQQLITILEHQRHQKHLKQMQLQRQVQKKEQALRLLQIQQIKKQIQFQVRKELQYQEQEDQVLDKQQDFNLLQKKQQMQKEIQEMVMNNNQELNQIDQQNEKLKDLIQRIKQEQKKVIQTMKFDVQEEENEEQEQYLMNREAQKDFRSSLETDPNQQAKGQQTKKNAGSSDLSQLNIRSQQLIGQPQSQLLNNNNSTVLQNISKLSQRNQQLTKQLKRKTDLQLHKEEMSFSRLRSIESSPQYRDRQKIQDLIQHYLNKPFQYPKQGAQDKVDSQKKQNKKYKNQLVEQLTNKSKKVRQFQQELLAVKHMQNFVPAQRDDPLTAHMLNLREAYQNQQADQLKRILFPAQMDKKKYDYQNEEQLSFESDETAPPVTLLDHLKIHEKQYQNQKKQKKTKSKNFLAINRMKLLQIQQQKKQRQRCMIEEATKNKIKALKMKQKMLKAKAKREKQQLYRKNNPDQNEKKQNQKEKKPKKIKKIQKKITDDKNKDQAEKNKLKQKKQNVINDKNIIVETLEQQNQNQFLGEEELKKMRQDLIQKSEKHINQQKNNQNIENQGQQQQQEQSEDYQGQAQDFDQLNDNEFLQNIQMLDEQIYGKQKKKQKQNQEKKEENQNQAQQQNQFLQIQKKSNEQNQMTEDQIKQNSQNIALMLLEQQKQKLKSDIMSYQDEIRSYISQQEYEVYQHFINENQLKTYINGLMQLSSAQIVSLNNNPTLQKDLQEAQSISLLVAKDYDKNLQIGMGIFHKQYASEGQYYCDFVLAHNMKYFLNMIFNFCRYIFQKDMYTNQVQFIFSLDAIEEELTLLHFSQFQAKCKRLGEVYVKSQTDKMRKYILKRNLFQNKTVDYEYPQQNKGLQIKTKVQIHQKLYKQKGRGFLNPSKVQYSSLDILLAYYFKNNEQQLAIFRKKVQNDLKYRQLLITSLLFQKKQISIKSIHEKHPNEQKRSYIYDQMVNSFFDVQQGGKELVTQTFFGLSGDLSKTVKRCRLNFDGLDIPYLIMHPAQAVNQIQSSNSSQVGTFLNLAPKYKILILPAQEYYMMENQNPDISVFFYIKHFIKNISQVKKQTYSRVYLPQISSDNWLFYKDLSQKLQQSVFQRQMIQIGWKNQLYNSLIYQPHHRDLIIQKPFIISLLSANIQKVVEGSPIFCKLIE